MSFGSSLFLEIGTQREGVGGVGTVSLLHASNRNPREKNKKRPAEEASSHLNFWWLDKSMVFFFF